MSPVTLSARLMIALARGHDPEEGWNPHVDERPPQSVRLSLGQAAA